MASQLRLKRLMFFIANDLVKFEEYEIDRARWQLSWKGEPLQRNRKSFDLSLYLIDYRDRVASEDELLQFLWPDQFVEERNLAGMSFCCVRLSLTPRLRTKDHRDPFLGTATGSLPRWKSSSARTSRNRFSNRYCPTPASRSLRSPLRKKRSRRTEL